MENIIKLIEQECQSGVELAPLWSVTIWDKKFKGIDKTKQKKVLSYPYLLADDLFSLQQEEGDVFLLSTGEKTGWTTEALAGSNLCVGEVVTIPWGKSRPVSEVIKYYNGKFVTADNRIATSVDTDVLRNKYLYYWMVNQGKQIDRFYRGDGLKHPSMRSVLDMRIPLPSIEVQDKIIRILDDYTQMNTELISSLKAELEARKTQYDYYRKSIFASAKDATVMTLGDIGKVCMCKRVMKAETSTEGDVPFYKIGTFGQTADAFISKELYDAYRKKYSFPRKGEILISASGTIGKAVVYDGAPAYFQDSNIVWISNDESLVTNEYLRQYYLTFPWKARDGGTISRLYNDIISSTPIPVPSKDEQNNVIGQLLELESLYTSLFSHIEKEILLRNTQYSHYRNRVLSFAKAQQ